MSPKLIVVAFLLFFADVDAKDFFEILERFGFCSFCSKAFNVLIEQRKSNDNGGGVEELCDLLPMKSSRESCRGYTDLYLDTINYIVDRRPNVTGADFCSVFLQNHNCHGNVRKEWSVNVDGVNPGLRKMRDRSKEPLRIVHLTDIHYDEFYSVGSNSNCDQTVCCHGDANETIAAEHRAGRWGSYGDCDIPASIMTSAFKFIKENIKYDVVYFTGDITNHEGWERSREANVKIIKYVLGELDKYLGPNKAVFPTLGNHEAHPMNLYAPSSVKEPEHSTEWLYKLCAEQWSRWLPHETSTTISHGGYYTALIRPGLRLVALNTNAAYTNNFWLLYDDVDMYGQLRWFADTLQAAEKRGENVHVLAHIPPGDVTCYVPWSREFKKIYVRYSNTITGLFSGHTHDNDFNLIFADDKPPTAPVGLAFTSGSLTTWQNYNPNFFVFTADAGNGEILDAELYTVDLEEANKDPDAEPRWFSLYRMREEYGLEDLSPRSVSNLVDAMSRNESLRTLYYWNQARGSRPRMLDGCGKRCQKKNACKMVKSVYNEDAVCETLKDIINY